MKYLNLALVLAFCACAPRPLADERAALAAALPAETEPRPARLEKLAKALRHGLAAVRVEAARVFARYYVLTPAELKPLVLALDDRSPAVRAAVARAILVHLPALAVAKPGPVRAAERVPGPPAGARAPAAIPGADPFAAVRGMNEQNLRNLADLSAALESRLRSQPSMFSAPSVWQMLQQTTLGSPHIPMPIGSSVLPP